jgi:hypothetical protein
MAKKQTRRSISVSKGTYERLRAYCETNGISMSQFVEKRVGEVLGRAEKQPTPGAQPPQGSGEQSGGTRKDADVKLSPDRIFTF